MINLLEKIENGWLYTYDIEGEDKRLYCPTIQDGFDRLRTDIENINSDALAIHFSPKKALESNNQPIEQPTNPTIEENEENTQLEAAPQQNDGEKTASSAPKPAEKPFSSVSN